MRYFYFFFSLLFVCTGPMGCSDSKSTEELPVIDLNKSVDSETLKLSDVFENMRIIRLETTPESLLPGFFYAWVGNKYIVTIGEQEILLFTVDGKYVRKVAGQGRGPEEFLYILAFCVDEQEEHLYLADGDNRVCVIDLQKGKILRKIPTRGGTPYRLLLKEDTLTYIPLPGVDKKEWYDICRMKVDGTFIDGIRGDRSGEGGGAPHLEKIGPYVHYKMNTSDTLFQLRDFVKQPYYRLVTDQPYSAKTGKGKTVEVLFENKNLMILANTLMEVKTEGDMMYSSTAFLGHFVVDKKSAECKKIHGFYIDLLDYTDTERFPMLLCGKKAYRNINVSRFKEMMKDKLDSPRIADSLKTLYQELNEDDNSLLLVGEVRD